MGRRGRSIPCGRRGIIAGGWGERIELDGVGVGGGGGRGVIKHWNEGEERFGGV